MERLNFKRPDLNILKPKISKTTNVSLAMKVFLAMMGLLLLIVLPLSFAMGIFDDADAGAAAAAADADDPCATVTCPAASGVCKIAGTCQPASGTCSTETNVSDTGIICEDDGQGNISACLSGSCDRVACAANYYVASGACTACPGGETNDAGDTISSGNTTCDSSGPSPGMCNSILPLPAVQAARYNIQENYLELGNNFNVTVSCKAGYGPPAPTTGGQTGTGALPCPNNNTNYTVYGCQACAADYHVASGACAPCPGGETNDAGDTISSGDTTCDQPPVPEWIIGQNGETCTEACIGSNKTCSQDDWATQDVYNNMPAEMTTRLCQMTQPSQYVSDANMPAVIGNDPITPYRMEMADGTSAACVRRSVGESAAPNCDGDPGYTAAQSYYLGLARQRFCKCE